MLPVIEYNNITPEHQFRFGVKNGSMVPEQCHRISNKTTCALEERKYSSVVSLNVQ